MRDDPGELIGFATVTRDLTQRRAGEQNLRRSEGRFRLLVVRSYFCSSLIFYSLARSHCRVVRIATYLASHRLVSNDD